MRQDAQRILAEGAAAGILAGAVFAAAEIIVAALMGAPAVLPLRMFASISMGPEALSVVPASVAAIVGTITHLAFSAIFGVLYAALVLPMTYGTRARPVVQAGSGALFGLAVWFLNFQLVARAFYPWFLATSQTNQAILHALAFGVPLGVVFAAIERRAGPTVHPAALGQERPEGGP